MFLLCRICLNNNVKMNSIKDEKLLQLLEIFTSCKLNSEDGMPTTVCYICVSQLRRCRRFFDMVNESTRALTHLLHNGIEVSPNYINSLNLGATQMAVKVLPHISLVDTLQGSTLNEVKEEVVKEKPAKDDSINNETRLDGVNDPSVKVKEEPVVKEEVTEYEEPVVKEEVTENEVFNGEPVVKEEVTEDEVFNEEPVVKEEVTEYEVFNEEPVVVKEEVAKYDVLIDDKESTLVNLDNSADLKQKSSNTMNDTIYSHYGPYICDICGKKCFWRCDLTRHLRVHTGEKPFSCTQCQKAFKLAAHLKQHMLIHSGEKTYRCETCNKTFKTLILLKLHKRIHNDEKPYSCNICKKAFYDASNMKRHMYTHSGEKPFACSRCTKTFISASNLRRHMNTHTGEKPYSCYICGKTFFQSAHLKVHTARIHTCKDK